MAMLLTRFLVLVCLLAIGSQGHGMTCFDVISDSEKTGTFIQPQSPLQLAQMLQSRYHSLAAVRDQGIRKQQEVVTDVLTWISFVIPASTFLAESVQHELYIIRSELTAWSEKLSHGEEITPVYWSSFSKTWLSSVSVVNRVQGRLHAISSRQNREERERLHKLDEVWAQLIGTFSGSKKADRIVDLIPYLRRTRSLLVQIASLGEKNSSVENLQALADFYLEDLPRLARKPVTKVTPFKIWDHFHHAILSAKVGGEVPDLAVVVLAENELNEIGKARPDQSLVELQKWSQAFVGVLEWWLEELPAHHELARRKAEVVGFYRSALEEINCFVRPKYQASEASLAELRTTLLMAANKLVLWKEFGQPSVPRLVRIPKNDDPGDDPRLLAFDLFLLSDAPEILKATRDAVNLIYSLRTLHSVLHWLGDLSPSAAVRKKLNALVEEADNDSRQPAIALSAALEARSSQVRSRNRDTYRSYESYYTQQLKTVRAMLPEQKFSGMALAPSERLVQTMKVLEHYIQYLKEGSWNRANIYEVLTVGRVVFAQFSFVQEFFNSDGAKQLTEQIRKRFSDYLESVTKWMARNQTLDYEKENAIESLENMYEALEVILSLEDSTYHSSKRKVQYGGGFRDQSIEDWTGRPASYEEWVRTISTDVLNMSESSRSLQWALYVFGLKEFPTQERRNEVYRELARKFHPDSGGDTEAMQIVNAARGILKLYEE